MSINKPEYLSGLRMFKTWQDTYNDSIFARKAALVGALTYKGKVTGYANLPTEGQTIGDMYNVTNAGGVDFESHPINAGDNVVWNGTGWDNFGGTVFTDALKTKLEGIETGAQVNVIETVKVDGTALTVTDKTVNIDLSGKVDKVAGKQLSTEDFTTALKTKLEAIQDETITQADIDTLFA